MKSESVTILDFMRSSSRLFFDPDVIYEDDRARQRALWLYHVVGHVVRSSPELKGYLGPGGVG